MFLFRSKQSIEFELKDFQSVYNNNIGSIGIETAKCQYGAYKFSLKAHVNKFEYQENGDLWFIIGLFCESDDKINFPLIARMNFLILNKDKVIRKALSTCN